MKTSAIIVATVAATLAVAALAAGVFIHSGAYDIGADSHHTKPVHALMQTLRERSIERRAKDIVARAPPDEDMEMDMTGHDHDHGETEHQHEN
jgi:hypothetical protein